MGLIVVCVLCVLLAALAASSSPKTFIEVHNIMQLTMCASVDGC